MSIEKEISEILAKKKAGTIAEQVGADKVGDGPKTTPGNTSNPGDNADNARNATGSTSYKSKLPKGSSDGKTSTAMKPREKKFPSHFSAPGQTRESAEGHEGEELTEVDTEMTMDDHIAALLEGETLSEAFKAKAATIFEAAVLQRVKSEVERLEEEFEARLQEQFEETAEGLVEQVDGYLDLMVQKWMEDNELALESGMRNEITEGFISGLRQLFAESYIEVPEEKADLVAELESELASLREQFNESVALNVEMNRALTDVARAEAIAEVASDMTELDLAKFEDLAGELVFEDVESFREKLEVIRENYFKKKPGAATLTESVVTDTPVLTEEAKTEPKLDGRMAAYVATLNKI
jgi:hypothetical protein